MSKLKARIDQAVAGDLGVELSSNSTNLQEVTANPDLTESLVMAFIVDDTVYYDLVPVWRYVNGMRIKLPKFQSRPIIEGRLNKQLYQRYYTLGHGVLTPFKFSKPNDLRTKLPYRVGEDYGYQTEMVIPELTMGLRKKSLLYHRQGPTYELPTAVLARAV